MSRGAGKAAVARSPRGTGQWPGKSARPEGTNVRGVAYFLFMRHIDLMRPDHAYFFGFAQTDGNHYAGVGQKGSFAIELSARDDAVLHSFAALFEVNSRVSCRERVTNFGPHRAAVWTVSSLAFRRELTELGLPAGPKSSTVAPPTQPFTVRDYVRGLIDGDGSVGFTRTGKPFLSFTTASQPLADYFITEIMDVTGVYRSVNRNARDGVYNPMLTGEPAATMAEWLYADACLALDRKRAAATLVAVWTRPEGMRARPLAGVRRWTAEEDADVFNGTPAEAAIRLGRSEKSVIMRRFRLTNSPGY